MNETWWVDPSQLDADQTAVLLASPDTNLLIAGPPGSGKTNILMLRANYVRPIGSRQLLITFTRSLAEHLRSGPNVGRADQIQREEISTFMGWGRAFLTHNGGTLPSELGDFDKDRRALLAALESFVEEQNFGQVYDVVFVDEVQDFWERELNLLHRLADRLNFAGDSRQRIWKGEGLVTAKSKSDEVVELKKHYRIGEKICEYADQILPPKADQAPLLESCNYNERARPSTVEPVPCDDEDDMVKRCIEKIKEQLRYITDEPIGVISPTHEALDLLMNLVRRDDVLSAVTVRQKAGDYHAYDDESRVRVLTIHSAKGSEFRAVHLLNGELFKAHNRELAFTGVTRAKTEVYVYHLKPLMGHMSPPTRRLTTDLTSLF